MDYERFKEIAQEHGLTVMGLTGSFNGYPEPEKGFFAYGVADCNHAKRIAEEHGLVVYKARWKDGWGYATAQGEADGELQIAAEWLGDGYEVIDDGVDDDILGHYGYDTEERMRRCEGEMYEARVEAWEEIMRVSESIDFSRYVMVLCERRFHEKMSKCHFDFDTEHIAVGVAYLWEE